MKWTPFDLFKPLTAEQIKHLRKELELYSRTPLVIMSNTFQTRIKYIGPPPRYEPPLEDTP